MAATIYMVEILFANANWDEKYIVDVLDDSFISDGCVGVVEETTCESIRVSYVRFGSDGKELSVSAMILGHFRSKIMSALKGFQAYVELTVTAEEAS